MAKAYVLYNPLAGNGTSQQDVKKLETMISDPIEYFDVTRITNYSAFLNDLAAEDYLILCGGDGTLNRFINNTSNINITQEILYYPMGSGNDFAREVCPDANKPVTVTKYLKDLPNVEVNGKSYRFLNGIGFGIDGYCCEVGEKLRAESSKKIDYTSIAIKGLLFHFDSRNAKVTVDGKTYEYKNVWIAPTMNGKYYGGGMIPTPGQDRLDPEKKLSVLIFKGKFRIPVLCVFPSIFKGKHINHKKKVNLHTGHKITVEFDRPTPLQIDGETILGVTSYTAYSSASI